jgi:hypothetical protein
MKYFCAEGNGSSAINVKQGLGIGKGRVFNYLRRAVNAVLSICGEAIFWPNEKERKEISSRI